LSRPVAVVTGAGSGIGRATAARIAAEKGRVVATDISRERLADLTAELGDHDVVTVAGDVADQTVVDSILAAAGQVDALANVAGIMDGFLPPSEVDDATWERVFAVNVTGPMRLTRAVLPAMIEAGRGAIVNVASEAVLRPSAAGAAYAASKHALLGYTRSIAFFHAPQGVRANVVVPGPVQTNIEGQVRSAYAGSRIGPVMQATMPAPALPESVATAIVWLLSDDAANINGAVLPSDGGWSAS
jgi:NAD(P)-dependent dehydrogenase (short-subunit alcohol dehydrogenase family)